MDESRDQNYRSMVDPMTADKRGRVIPAYGMRRKRILLDAAFVDQEFLVQGDYVYADFNSTGTGEIRLNSPSEDPWPILALAGVADLPYEKIYLTSSAQAGKFLNLWYGYRSRFISPTSAIATIGSITNPVSVVGPRALNLPAVLADMPVLTREMGMRYGVNFTSRALLANSFNEVVFSAASNVNGAIIWDAQMATSGTKCMLGDVQASPPAGTDILFGANPAGNAVSPRLARPIFYPAGTQLAFLGIATETFAERFVLYTLL